MSFLSHEGDETGVVFSVSLPSSPQSSLTSATVRFLVSEEIANK